MKDYRSRNIHIHIYIKSPQSLLYFDTVVLNVCKFKTWCYVADRIVNGEKTFRGRIEEMCLNSAIVKLFVIVE